MTTTDAQGILYLEDTDPITPFQTVFNAAQSATSAAIENARRGPLYAASSTERTAYLTEYGSSSTEPLWVDMAGALYRHDGTGWKLASDVRRGGTTYAGTTVLSTSWSTLISVTAISGGALASARWSATLDNDNSGGSRTVNCRVLCDGAVIGNSPDLDIPAITGFTHRVSAGHESWSTPAAGSHTWSLQFQASAAGAVRCRNAVLTVVEQAG